MQKNCRELPEKKKKQQKKTSARHKILFDVWNKHSYRKKCVTTNKL